MAIEFFPYIATGFSLYLLDTSLLGLVTSKKYVSQRIWKPFIILFQENLNRLLNFDYTFKNNNILHFNGSFYCEDYNRNNKNLEDYYQANGFLEKIWDETKFDDKGDLFRMYLDYKTNDTLKWKHEVGYGIVWGKSNGLTTNNNTSEKPEDIEMSEIAIRNKHHGTQHQIHYDLIYSHNDLELKVGARADFGNLFPSSRYDSIVSGQPVYNPLFSSKYKHKENIYATYASLQYKYKKFSVYAGLRAEFTDMSINSVYDKIDWDYNKTHIFPYAKINANFDIFNTSLSFSSGIDRPPYLYYTPNYRYSSKYCYAIGNPNLLPTKYYKVGFENLLFDFFKIKLLSINCFCAERSELAEQAFVTLCFALYCNRQ